MAEFDIVDLTDVSALTDDQLRAAAREKDKRDRARHEARMAEEYRKLAVRRLASDHERAAKLGLTLERYQEIREEVQDQRWEWEQHGLDY